MSYEKKKMAEDEGTAELSCYMMKVIDDLMAGKKYSAVHTSRSMVRRTITDTRLESHTGRPHQ